MKTEMTTALCGFEVTIQWSHSGILGLLLVVVEILLERLSRHVLEVDLLTVTFCMRRPHLPRHIGHLNDRLVRDASGWCRGLCRG